MEARAEILLLDKPEGITSFRFLGSVKKGYPAKTKIGHAGTLDSFASGLMIVLVGNATRLNTVFSTMDKTYEALIRFGEETDTLDPEGRVVKVARIPDEKVIDGVLPSFVGRITQRPPEYSAVHVGGKRAYEKARKGLEFEMPEREVEVYSLNKISYSDGFLKIRVRVSKGTYIRSLARDIGVSCGSAARLEKLRRTSIGPYGIECCQACSTREILDATGLFGKVVYNPDYEKQIINGMIRSEYILQVADPDSRYFYMYVGDRLYGISERDGQRMKVLARMDDDKM